MDFYDRRIFVEFQLKLLSNESQLKVMWKFSLFEPRFLGPTFWGGGEPENKFIKSLQLSLRETLKKNLEEYEI